MFTTHMCFYTTDAADLDFSMYAIVLLGAYNNANDNNIFLGAYNDANDITGRLL